MPPQAINLATRYSLLATRYSLLATRYSLLATRYSALIPPHAVATAASMPLRIVLAFSLVILSACASRPVVPREAVQAAAEPLPPEIKPLTLEQEEQVAE